MTEERHWIKKLFCGRLTKGGTRDNALGFKFAFLNKFSTWYQNFNLSSKIMPNNFSFFEFVMVKSSSLIFAFSVPLSIKWHLSKLSLNVFSLNQLKCRIDKGYYHKGCYHLHNLQSNYCIKVGQVLILGVHQFQCFAIY